MADRLARLGCPEPKIHVVRLPADSDGLHSIARKTAEPFTVALAGRFVEKKGFELGIKAFAAAFGGRSDARLLLIGSGELADSYCRLAARLGIEDQTELTGELPFGSFMTRLASAHVALYPSRVAADGDSEGVRRSRSSKRNGSGFRR